MEFSGVIISLLAFSAFTNGQRNSARPPWPRPVPMNTPQNFPPTNTKNPDSFFNNDPGFDPFFNKNPNPNFNPFVNNDPDFNPFINNDPDFNPFVNNDPNFNHFSNNDPNNFKRVNQPFPPDYTSHTSPSKNSHSHKMPSFPNSRRNRGPREKLPSSLSHSPSHRSSSPSPIHTGEHPSSRTVPSGAPPAPPIDHTSPGGGPSDSSAPHVSSGGPPSPSDGPSEHKDSHSSKDEASNHESHASPAPTDCNKSLCCLSEKGYKIVCLFNAKHYYRNGFRPCMMDPCLCTHMNYEFAMLDHESYEMISSTPELDMEENFYQEATDLKKLNPHLKVYLSLGGWDDSTKKYSEMADCPEKRRNFVTQCVKFLKQHKFDGLDLAWEYPNCWQGALGVNPKDKENFVCLLRELKEEFVKWGMELSCSVGSIKREVEAAYDVPAVCELVSHINVMTYDLHGPWEHNTGHHTQFQRRPEDDDPYCNVKAAMELWAAMGADRSKLNMGIATYGKTFEMKDPHHCALGAPSAGPGCPGPYSKNGGFLMYNEICEGLNVGNWTEYECRHAGFYACNGQDLVCYDSPIMMVRKAKFIVDHHYGGVLIKDLSGDDYKGKCFNLPFPLLKICKMEMIKACGCESKTENSH